MLWKATTCPPIMDKNLYVVNLLISWSDTTSKLVLNDMVKSEYSFSFNGHHLFFGRTIWVWLPFHHHYRKTLSRFLFFLSFLISYRVFTHSWKYKYIKEFQPLYDLNLVFFSLFFFKAWRCILILIYFYSLYQQPLLHSHNNMCAVYHWKLKIRSGRWS